MQKKATQDETEQAKALVTRKILNFFIWCWRLSTGLSHRATPPALPVKDVPHINFIRMSVSMRKQGVQIIIRKESGKVYMTLNTLSQQ